MGGQQSRFGLMRSRAPEMLEMIRQLLSKPSVSSPRPEFDMSNREVVLLLAQWLEDSGFKVRIQPLEGNDQKFNLIAQLGEGSGGLALAGHLDTVPTDERLWRFDPFAGELHNGRIYGLGCADMKAFFAIALSAVIAAAGKNPLHHPVYILATADEESSMAGAKALVESFGPLACPMIIGEPTGLSPVVTHKGVLMERFVVHGRGGHSSDPGGGANAMEAMHAVITSLLEVRDNWQLHFQDPVFRVPVPTMNLGYIHGGDNPNRICERCELLIDIRPLPSMPMGELRIQMHESARRAIIGTGCTIKSESLFDPVPGFASTPDAWFLHMLEDLSEQPVMSVAFATEGPYYQQWGVQPVIWGPGDIACAHQPDENLSLDRIARAENILTHVITRCCTG